MKYADVFAITKDYKDRTSVLQYEICTGNVSGIHQTFCRMSPQ